MRSRALRILLWVVVLLLALPVAAIGLLATGPGGRVAGDAIGYFSAGLAKVHGLTVTLPGGIHADRIEVIDPKGTWLTIEDVTVAWSPAALFSRALMVEDLHAARIAVARLPASQADASTGGTSLPGRAVVRRLHVDRVELAAPVAGKPAALAMDGSARLNSLEQGEATLDVTRLGSPGSYRVAAKLAGGQLQARLALQEPEGGLVGGIAGLPAIGALDASATADGPLSALAVQASLGAGPLHAELTGVVDVPGNAGRIDATLTAPAMAPRPDLKFRAATLTAHLEGPFAAPRGTARIRLDGLEAGGIAVAGITADARAGDGTLHATAVISGIAGPGLEPLGDAPVHITLDGPFAGPLTITLRHPLVEITGTGAQDGTGELRLVLPDLARLQGLTGLAVAGSAETTANLRWQDDALAVDATGALAITAAPAPAADLLGPRATFTAAGTLRGSDVSGGRFTLDGKALRLALHGDWKSGIADAGWQVDLTDLAVLVPGITGRVRLDGHTSGPADDLAMQAKLAGDLAGAGAPASPVTAAADLRGLPLHPAGTLTVGGTLDGAPVSLDANLARATDGTLRFDLTQAGWKSGTGSAHLVWRPGDPLPQGQVALAMPKLADAGKLLGLPLAGGAELSATFAADKADAALKLSGAGLPGTATVASATVAASLRDPMGARDLSAKLTVTGLAAGGMATGLTLDASGPPDQLDLKLDADTGPPGDPIRLAAAARLDAFARRLDLHQFRATWRGETASLAAPARIDFAQGVAVDRLRLGLRGAALELAGRLFPTLDLTAALTGLPLDMARLVMPDAKAEGRIQATARLTGPPATPSGTIRLAATGLRWREGVGAALRPGSLTANVALAGTRATLDLHAESGDTTLALAGTAPLGQGPLDLRITGRSGLAALDAVLAAGGRQLRGTVALDATLGGTLAAPRAGGRLTLTGGALQDRTLGLRLRDLSAEIVGDGETIRLARLSGRAGSGSIAAQGTLGLGAGMPVRLDLTLRQARLLSSTLVTGTVDADLSVTGGLADRLAAAGTITLGRTDITVPESLPVSVPVLNVRRPGDAPPARPAPPLPIALDVTVKAPREIFLRGRGIDAELQGELHIGGEVASLRPSGGFSLRRGSFTLAGQTLNFTTGTVTLDGALPIDPVLDFKASTTSTGTAGTIIATVAITGHAGKPVITLTSVPQLPPDEVPAQLLFNRSATTLGPLELAQLTAALAELSGVGPKTSPLEALRAKLGLDRLSVGAGTNGAAASVQAGRTIAPGVYLGAKQNAGAGGTQATVEIDLYKGLKLKADVGTGGGTSATGAAGSNGTGVGLTYQFEY